MYPCPIRMRAQSFQNFSRKAILKVRDQLSQHDRCKNLNQRHLRYARRFKSTNQRITTVGSSNKHPCAGQGCGFLPSLLARRGPRVSLAPKTTQTPATQARSWLTLPEKSHWILQKADRTTWKYTLQDINTTPKEPKTERGCSRRQLFRHFYGSSVRRNE